MEEMPDELESVTVRGLVASTPVVLRYTGVMAVGVDVETDAMRKSVAIAPEKVPVTFRATLIVTVHVVAVPVHAPLQPVNVEPVAGAAVNVTDAPPVKAALQPAVPLQLIPAGDEVTVPLPEVVIIRG